MVYVRAVNSFFYYDTLRYSNLRDGDFTSKRMRPLLGMDKQPQFIPATTPQQENSSDCGVLVISIIDYILHQLLKSRCQKKGPVQYNKIMKLNSEYMSTPKQVRYNIYSMIERLQQRCKKS
jgi:sentrin-specific protease 8